MVSNRTVRVVSTLCALALVACDPEGGSTPHGTQTGAPPGTPEIQLSPAAPQTRDNLVVEVLNPLTHLRYGYEWRRDGELISDLTSDLVPRARTQKGESWEVTVIPYDQRVAGPRVSDSVQVGNTAPEITSAAFEREVPSPGTGIAVHYTTDDVDGDEVSVRFSWTLDGAPTPDDGPTIQGERLARGQQWSVTLTPTDGEAEGESRTLTTEVGNTPPSIADVLLSPSTAFTDTVLVAEAVDVFDPDGDELTVIYRFFVNDRLVQHGEEPTLDGAEHFVKNQSVFVQAFVRDDLDRSDSVRSQDLLIQNTPPVAASITLLPDAAVTSTELVASVDGSDLDGDPLNQRFIWLINDVVVPEVSGPVLAPSFTTKDDRVVVRGYLVDDDEDESNVVESHALTVDNTPPTAPRATILPRAPIQGEDDLVCTIAEESFDDDGDPVSYTMTWMVDGLPIDDSDTTEWPGDTVRGDLTLAEELWTCAVTPFDGTDQGELATGRRRITFDGTILWDEEVTFTTCGATGRFGPTQAACNDTYRDSFLEDGVVVEEGIQIWEVPAPGDYRITAHGAQGFSADSSHTGGHGALIEGVFFLDEGERLRIAVGQRGVGDEASCNGGGGGGTWVMTISGDPLLIAGGGGGTRTSVRQDGCPGRVEEFGGRGSGSADTWSCALKTTDLRQGGIVSSFSWGSAGGGLESTGASDRVGGNGGRGWTQGLQGGGTPPGEDAYGGFGGGGAGNGSCGGGGGGGYSGGDGGRLAGGGGSFNGGLERVGVEGGADAGDGKVIIDLL